VLGRKLMVGADERPLEQRPNKLDAVGLNISPNPFLVFVIDAGVAGIGRSEVLVSNVLSV
jgi:hypothetical protein